MAAVSADVGDRREAIEGGKRKKSWSKRALQPSPGRVMVALMKRRGFIGGGGLLAYPAKRQDRQVCLLTC